MPLYEYKCDKCGDVFEVRQKFSDEPVHVHEKCGGTVERLISRSAFRLKGSGWYATDYAGKTGNGSAKTESGSKDASDTGGKTEQPSTESKSTESKSTESKSSESKPAESKPAAGDKSKSE
jgi:putative FmdB family regulatory protein